MSNESNLFRGVAKQKPPSSKSKPRVDLERRLSPSGRLVVRIWRNKCHCHLSLDQAQPPVPGSTSLQAKSGVYLVRPENFDWSKADKLDKVVGAVSCSLVITRHGTCARDA